MPTNEQIARLVNPEIWKRLDHAKDVEAPGLEILGPVVRMNHPEIVKSLEAAAAITALFADGHFGLRHDANGKVGVVSGSGVVGAQG